MPYAQQLKLRVVVASSDVVDVSALVGASVAIALDGLTSSTCTLYDSGTQG
jgi:hypothetical protein